MHYTTADNTTSRTWINWNITSACTGTSDSFSVWQQWTSAGTDGTVTSDAASWGTWVASGSSLRHSVTIPQLAEEERAVLEENRRVQEELRKEQEKKVKAAQRQAIKLFVSLVGRASYKRYKKRGYHELVAESGARYRIRPGQRVSEMDGNFGDKVKSWLCIYAEGQLPMMDQVVMQTLLLQSGKEGEKILRDTAIRTAA